MMKFIVAAVMGLFLMGADNAHEWLTFESIVGTGQSCYTTSHGIEVLTLNRQCPRKDLVEHETTRFLKRMSAPDFALRGVQVTLTPVQMNSSPGGNYGEIEIGTSRAVVMMMPHFMHFIYVWDHELAHILLDRVHEEVGALHVSYSEAACTLDLEACALLPATNNHATDEPQLATDNRYRIKFSKLTKKAINKISKEHKEARK